VSVALVALFTTWAVIVPLETVNVGEPGVPGVHAVLDPVTVIVFPVEDTITLAGDADIDAATTSKVSVNALVVIVIVVGAAGAVKVNVALVVELIVVAVIVPEDAEKVVAPVQ
jgi:hypothetical protein